MAFAFLFSHLTLLTTTAIGGKWIISPDRHYVFTDFAALWTTGLQIRQDPAEATYAISAHSGWERRFFDTGGRIAAWHYPPSFFFVVWCLALLPYPAAFLTWVFSTGMLYAAALYGIVRHRLTILFACAFPATLPIVIVGQTGFLTASLIALTLAHLERRPYWAGVALGCLTYKPQFGLLFPLALLAGRHWRAILSATATAIVIFTASGLCFGFDAWVESAISMAGKATFEINASSFGKHQSVFGLARIIGADETVAFRAQIAVGIIVSAVTWLAWRSSLPFDLKAATLAVATLLASPYVFTYDLVIIVVALTFLMRHALQTGLCRLDIYGAAAACLLIQVYPLAQVPTGPVAAAVVGVLTINRATLAMRGYEI